MTRTNVEKTFSGDTSDNTNHRQSHTTCLLIKRITTAKDTLTTQKVNRGAADLALEEREER